ncbi:hypothetical protein BDEG_20644 [Batrachochytrium dendrobatidis JEL423]|nr:hypothetical protein BDEG_20644 [Batrachochytrium dendrobatidis JEL423]
MYETGTLHFVSEYSPYKYWPTRTPDKRIYTRHSASKLLKMEFDRCGFLVIPVMDLTQPAGKPRHLEARFRKLSYHNKCTHAAASATFTFIEARRSKLAHRRDSICRRQAAHQSRASIAQSQRRSQMEQTLEQAARKRQLLLQEKVQLSAETVAHAKAVARSHSEQTAKATAALSAAIEERLKVSAMRRARLQTIPRSRLLDPNSWAIKETADVRNDAAITLQGWWRRRQLVPIANAYAKTNLSLASAKGMSFQKLMQVVQSDRLIKTVARLLLRAKKLGSGISTAEAATTTAPVKWKNPARVLLSAFMIVAYPSETLQSLGSQEEHLKQLAETMLCDFEGWHAAAKSDTMLALGRTFLQSYSAYYAAFDAWKFRDTVKIVDDLVSHFLDLEELWLSVKDQEDAQEQWAPRIDAQQKQIMDRLLQYGQNALDKIQSQRTLRLAAKTTSNVNLNETDGNSNDGPTSMSTSPPRQDQHLEHHYRSTSPKLFQAASPRRVRDSVLHRRTPSSSSGRSASPLGQSSDPSAPCSDTRMPIAMNEDASVAQSISPEFGHLFSNEQLAHELIMDPNFNLKKPTPSPLEQRITDIARRAFFDSVRQQVADGDYSHHIIQIIKDIKQGLMSMVAEDSKIAAEIHSVLSFDLIQQQITHNVFDLPRCIKYAGDKMLQLCAPMRDASIRKLAVESDIVNVLSQMLEILDEMKLDLTNYRLQALKPHLKRQAAEYEREKFATALKSGTASLTRTSEWLHASVAHLKSVAASRNPEKIDHPDLSIKFQDAFHSALLSIVFSNTSVDPATIPETLVMDAARFFAFQNQVQAISITAALLMLTKNIVPELRATRDFISMVDLKNKISALLNDAETNMDNLSLQIISTVNESLAKKQAMLNGLACSSSQTATASAKTLTEEQENMIRSMVTKTLSSKDPVYTLLSRRVQMTLKQHLDRGVFGKNSLASHGLDLVADELEQVSTRLYVLASHNKDVYAEYYDEILRDVI